MFVICLFMPPFSFHFIFSFFAFFHLFQVADSEPPVETSTCQKAANAFVVAPFCASLTTTITAARCAIGAPPLQTASLEIGQPHRLKFQQTLQRYGKTVSQRRPPGMLFQTLTIQSMAAAVAALTSSQRRRPHLSEVTIGHNNNLLKPLEQNRFGLIERQIAGIAHQ